MMPAFTILLAVVRPPTFLPIAIESVLAQTIQEFEILVVCDGAPPETIECANEYARRDPRIKVLLFPKGERFGEAHWHVALASATGRYVAHIEDDDLWFPDHLQELQKLLQEVDFGHLLHVWARPDDSIEMLPFDLALPEMRQRMLDAKFNRIGFTVCGYRMDCYRKLAEGWTPSPKGLWPDLHMWRKFLRRDDFTFGTRMAITAIVLASRFRGQLAPHEAAQISRSWLGRILDDRERAAIVQAGWCSAIGKELKLEDELSLSVAAQDETKAELERVRAAEAELSNVHLKTQAELNESILAHHKTQADLSESVLAHREMQADRNEVQAKLDKAVAERHAVEAELARVLNSRSWRITKPLRLTTTAIGQGMRVLWRPR